MKRQQLPLPAGKGKSRHPVTPFEPAAMLEVEISRPLPNEELIDHETGREYRRAVVLVRLHTRPLGLIELLPRGGGLSASQLAQGVWEALGPKINAHLQRDGLAGVTELGAEGLPSTGAPACLEVHQAFLARAPFVSVVVPTHDRPQQVVALVHSILASEYPPSRYEVIVVDNAPSTSATADSITQQYADRSHVRYVREDRPGAANARNRGLATARAEIVVFADDDELVDRHWLTEMVRGFETHHDITCVTGLIVPMESKTPAQGWFEQFGGYCTEGCTRRLFNLTDHRAQNPLYPYSVGVFGGGGSMAFKRSTLLEAGGFDPALGPATPTFSGEDIETLLRLILEGHTILYEPAAIVHHPSHREYARLRSQIYGYGTGFTACLFKTLVTKPRQLPDFIGKLPRGLLTALSPRSPHHADKRRDYPRELTWMELKGLLYGPLAYIRSRRRVARFAPPCISAAYIELRVIPVGQAR
jgi:GT2 family glycosyltransferase